MPLTPETWRAQWVANTVTAGSQQDPHVVQLADGTFWVAWVSYEDTGAGAASGADIIGQRYDQLGNAMGGEVRLNNSWTVDDERDFDIAALPDGGMVLVFIDYYSTGGTYDVRLNELNANGTNRSSTTVASDVADTSLRDPQVAVNSNSEVFISYIRDNTGLSSPTYDQVYARVYNSTTNALGSEFLLFQNVSGNGYLGNLDSAVLTNGDTVTVAQANFTGGDNEIWFNIADSDGNPDTLLYVLDTQGNTDSDTDPTVAALTGGGFVIVWSNTDTNDTDIMFQRYTNAGAEVGGSIFVGSLGATDNHNEVRVVSMSDGGFLILYDDDEAGQYALRGQRYDSTGSTVGSSFALDTGSSGIQSVEATLLGDGRVAVTWLNGEIQTEIIDTRDNASTGNYTPDGWQIGTVGSDTFTADGTSEIVHGWDGNDIITESGMVREYYGGDGNDRLNVVSPINTDRHDGGAGTDTINWFDAGTFVSGATFNLAAGTATQGASTEVMVNFENLWGTNNAETVIGSAGANYIYTYDGNDSIDGGGGDDTLYGVGGDDTIDGGAGNDTIYGGGGNDTIIDDSGDNYMDGGTGDDLFMLSNSTLSDETIIGGAGTDTLDYSGVTGSSTTFITAFDLDEGYQGNATVPGSYVGTWSGLENFVGIVGYRNHIIGNSSANQITGGDDNDTIIGELGNDTLNGGLGDDTFVHSNDGSNDSLVGGSGNDTADLSGSTAGWTINTSGVGTSGGSGLSLSSIEIILGTNYADDLYESGSVETISAGAGDDIVRDNGASSATDYFDGGSGNDTIDFSASVASRSLDLGTGAYSSHGGAVNFENAIGGSGDDTITGTAGANTIEGGDGNDSVLGGGGNDLLGGDAGADVIEGGIGNDSMYGGGGNDVLIGGSGNDLFNGGAGYDTADYSAATDNLVVNINWPNPQAVSALQGTDTLVNMEGIEGGSGNDLLVGNAGGNIIRGNGGNDDIYGLAGADVLEGGAGNDRLEGSGGDDTMTGGAGNDTVNYYNAAGAVSVNLNLQGGAQAVGGGMGNDWLSGFENLYGSNGFGDTLVGDGGNNEMIGYGGNDTIFGAGGDDTIYGMGGDDVLTGNLGADLIGGGGGDDFFDFNAVSESTTGSRDTITDFGTGNDVIALNTIDANTTVAGNQAFTWIGGAGFTAAGQLRFVTNGTDGFVLGDVNGDGTQDLEIRLLGVTSMDAADFIL